MNEKELKKLPVHLRKSYMKAIDYRNSLIVIRNVETIKPRYEAAVRDLESLENNIKTLLDFKNRKYDDDTVFEVIGSDLDVSSFGEEHLIKCIKLEMNANSFIWFLQQRDFCKGKKWVQTQNRVIKFLAKNEEELVELTEINDTNTKKTPSYKKRKV